MTNVAVSILNYQAAHETVRCVESLLTAQTRATGGYSLEVHVADNGSAADDLQILKGGLKDLRGVFLHDHQHNLGFSAGHNRNIDRLLSGSAPDYLWLLNNDCRVDDRTVPALLDCAAKRPEVGIWGATLLDADGQTVQAAGGCFYWAWLSFYRQHGKSAPLSAVDSLQPMRYDYIAGASLFLPVAALRDGFEPPRRRDLSAGSSLLNEEFFLYFEELDLAQRLRPQWKMAWCRSARVRHIGGFGTGSGKGQRSAQAEYHATLSALKFTSLYFPRRLWFMAPARFLAKSIQLLLAGKPRLMESVTRAYGDFWRWLRQDLH